MDKTSFSLGAVFLLFAGTSAFAGELIGKPVLHRGTGEIGPNTGSATSTVTHPYTATLTSTEWHTYTSTITSYTATATSTEWHPVTATVSVMQTLTATATHVQTFTLGNSSTITATSVIYGTATATGTWGVADPITAVGTASSTVVSIGSTVDPYGPGCGLDPAVVQGGPANVGTCQGAVNECTGNYGMLAEAERDVGAAGFTDEQDYNFCKKYDCKSRYFKICTAIQLGYNGSLPTPEERYRTCKSRGLLAQPQCAAAMVGLLGTLEAISTIARDPAPNNEEPRDFHVSADKMPIIEDCQKQVAKCKADYQRVLEQDPNALNDADAYDRCARDFRMQFHVTFGSMCNDAVLELRNGLRFNEFLYQKRQMETPNPGMCEMLTKQCASNYQTLLDAYVSIGRRNYEKKCEPAEYTGDLGTDCQTARDMLMLGIGESNFTPDVFFQMDTNNCRRTEVVCGDQYAATHEKLMNTLQGIYDASPVSQHPVKH